MEEYAPGSTQLPDGSVLTGIEININNFYNKIAKLADPSDGLVALLPGGGRYSFLECNEKRTRISAGDATYDLRLKRMDIAQLLSNAMVEEYNKSTRERPYGAPVLGLVADDTIRDRRTDYARRESFQSAEK